MFSSVRLLMLGHYSPPVLQLLWWSCSGWSASSLHHGYPLFSDEGKYYNHVGDYLKDRNEESLPVPSIWTPRHALMSVAPCVMSPGVFEVCTAQRTLWSTLRTNSSTSCRAHSCRKIGVKIYSTVVLMFYWNSMETQTSVGFWIRSLFLSSLTVDIPILHSLFCWTSSLSTVSYS